MNTTVRVVFVCVLLACIAGTAGLAAQESQVETGLAKVDAATRLVTNNLVQALRIQPRQAEKYRLRLGSFTMDGASLPLGSLWANNLATFLASAAAAPGANIVLNLVEEPRPDFVVQGELVLAADTVRVFTRLIRMDDGAVVKGAWSDLVVDPVLARMLLPSEGSDGTEQDPYEIDSREFPKAVILGTAPIARTLHTGDEDWFRFQVTQRGILVAQTFGELDTVLTLYQVGSEEELLEDDDSGDSDNARIEHAVIAGSTFLIKVSGYDGATGSYNFNLALDPMPPQTTRNDTRERALNLTPDGESQRFLFERQNEEDWFIVSVSGSGNVLQISTYGSLDMLMELYDSQGNKLAEDDDSGQDGNARLSTLLPQGQYFLRLYEYEGKQGLYRMTTKLIVPGPSDLYEPDDTSEDAKPIRVGESQGRNFNHPGDIDWAILDLASNGIYALSARPPRDTGLDTYIELYDEAGQLLDEDDDGGDSLDSYLELELSAGRYYLKLWQVDEEIAGNGSYELLVDAL